jgi:GNAT superfamily N-acetyltransferase
MPFEIAVTEDPGKEVISSLAKRLEHFNEIQSGYPNHFRQLAILVSNSSTNEIVGGLWGQTAMSFLHIYLLYLPEDLRGNGLGQQLMARAEEEAVRRGCCGSWLDTFSFQAPSFYERLGYTVVGSIENFPPGHTRYFMKKTL